MSAELEEDKYICPYCGAEMKKSEPNENMSFDVLAVCPNCKYVKIGYEEDEE